MPRLLPFSTPPDHAHAQRQPAIMVSPVLAQLVNDLQILAIMDQSALSHIATHAHCLALHARKRRRPR